MTAPRPQLFIFKEHYAPREIHSQLSGIEPQRPLFNSAAVGEIYHTKQLGIFYLQYAHLSGQYML